MAVDRILHRDRLCGGVEMRDDLMPEQVEVDPVIARTPLGTAKNLAIEMAGGGQVVDRKGEVEGRRVMEEARKAGCVLPPFPPRRGSLAHICSRVEAGSDRRSRLRLLALSLDRGEDSGSLPACWLAQLG
jgi:hypothetical protein